MQRSTVVPGFWLVTELNIAALASLSPIATVPAANWLLVFAVVLVNAEKVPKATTLPRRPSVRTLRRILRVLPAAAVVLMWVLPPAGARIPAAPPAVIVIDMSCLGTSRRSAETLGRMSRFVRPALKDRRRSAEGARSRAR